MKFNKEKCLILHWVRYNSRLQYRDLARWKAALQKMLRWFPTPSRT